MHFHHLQCFSLTRFSNQLQLTYSLVSIFCFVRSDFVMAKTGFLDECTKIIEKLLLKEEGSSWKQNLYKGKES